MTDIRVGDIVEIERGKKESSAIASESQGWSTATVEIIAQ